MSAPLIAFVMLIYIAVSANELWNGNKGMAIVFFGYAVSNIGFIMALNK